MGVLLRFWRERRGHTLHELADEAGVSWVTISKIENDRMSPTVATLEKLAKALNIRVRDLFPVGRPKGRRRAKGDR